MRVHGTIGAMRADLEADTPRLVPGLTLRDLFAMAALAGTLASDTEESHRPSALAAAEFAYAQADAMLAAREKGGAK